MTPKKLLDICHEGAKMGLSRVILTMPRPKSRRRNTFQKSVRIPFGYGRVMNYDAKTDRLVFAIEIEKVTKYFSKVVNS